jgi:poly-D-alanine transfer protein DltD
MELKTTNILLSIIAIILVIYAIIDFSNWNYRCNQERLETEIYLKLNPPLIQNQIDSMKNEIYKDDKILDSLSKLYK